MKAMIFAKRCVGGVEHLAAVARECCDGPRTAAFSSALNKFISEQAAKEGCTASDVICGVAFWLWDFICTQGITEKVQ